MKTKERKRATLPAFCSGPPSFTSRVPGPSQILSPNLYACRLVFVRTAELGRLVGVPLVSSVPSSVFVGVAGNDGAACTGTLIGGRRRT